MTQELEYGDAMIAMLELIWGRGFMAPGGEGNVDNLMSGISVENKRILDIGCGGGLVSEPLTRLGATVTGIDPSAETIARRTRSCITVSISSGLMGSLMTSRLAAVCG